MSLIIVLIKFLIFQNFISLQRSVDNLCFCGGSHGRKTEDAELKLFKMIIRPKADTVKLSHVRLNAVFHKQHFIIHDPFIARNGPMLPGKMHCFWWNSIENFMWLLIVHFKKGFYHVKIFLLPELNHGNILLNPTKPFEQRKSCTKRTNEKMYKSNYHHQHVNVLSCKIWTATICCLYIRNTSINVQSNPIQEIQYHLL